MRQVTIRELRNHGGDVIDQVVGGERLIVTRDGRAVAQLAPLDRPALSAHQVVERWRRLAPVDPERLRADVDAVVDASL
jgi:prevent-host-death family protein